MVHDGKSQSGKLVCWQASWSAMMPLGRWPCGRDRPGFPVSPAFLAFLGSKWHCALLDAFDWTVGHPKAVHASRFEVPCSSGSRSLIHSSEQLLVSIHQRGKHGAGTTQDSGSGSTCCNCELSPWSPRMKTGVVAASIQRSMVIGQTLSC